jgi:hypothetical protein
MILELRIVPEVEGRITTVKPRKRVADVVELWELHLVHSQEHLLFIIFVTWAAAAVGRWPTPTVCVAIALQA